MNKMMIDREETHFSIFCVVGGISGRRCFFLLKKKTKLYAIIGENVVFFCGEYTKKNIIYIYIGNIIYKKCVCPLCVPFVFGII